MRSDDTTGVTPAAAADGMSGVIKRVRPLLHDRLGRWLRREERHWLAAIAPQLVANVTSNGDTGWRTERVTFTGTSVAIATVVHFGSPGRYLVKVPWTAVGVQSLRHQAAVLATLWQEPRLPDLRPVLPRRVGQGRVEERYYCVEEALPGVSAGPLMARHDHRAALLRNAGAVIKHLHAGTRRRTVLDRLAVRAWVDAPLRRLEEFALTRPQPAPFLGAVARLREELVGVLLGRTVHLGWIHGDFWPGNLLVASDSHRVTGVVDWDCAVPGQLPLHDLLHLHVLARRLASGEALGDIVVRALHSGIEQTLEVPVGDVAAWLDSIPPRAALLLYWLRQVLLFIDSGGDHDSPRWQRANVERVLSNV